MRLFESFLFVIIIIATISCDRNPRATKGKLAEKDEVLQTPNKTSLINPQTALLETRIKPPSGFERIAVQNKSYAEYLRTIKLKPAGSKVNYYNGEVKENRGIYVAVVDLKIGKKDLHQCADAVMRLRAEYLWNNQQYEDIHFNFTNGFKVDYKEWMKGRRIVVEGNKTSWNNANQPSNTYQDFWQYMEMIFMYAGTASLTKELKSITLEEMQIGDVFIQGGHPGHAVLVMDMAIHPSNGKQIFLLAQSYMPAQETQILVNPNDQILSPWYELKNSSIIKTPEWTFKNTDLKRFEE